MLIQFTFGKILRQRFISSFKLMCLGWVLLELSLSFRVFCAAPKRGPVEKSRRLMTTSVSSNRTADFNPSDDMSVIFEFLPPPRLMNMSINTNTK